jgi:hypothetical protein
VNTATTTRLVTTIIIRHVLLMALMLCCAFAVVFSDMPTPALWLSLAFTVPGVIGAVAYFALVRSWTRWLAALCGLAVLFKLAQVFWRRSQ